MHLAAYLNDHLSGATAVLDLLHHLKTTHPDLAGPLEDLHDDIAKDREELQALISRLRMAHSTIRQTAAWFSEKLALLKMRVDDVSGGKLKLLEALEAVAIGIHGKGSMWRALKDVPSASGLDYDRLIARADDQRQRIEPLRLGAARAALADDS